METKLDDYDTYNCRVREHLNRIKEIAPIFKWRVGIAGYSISSEEEFILGEDLAESSIHSGIFNLLGSIEINGEQLMFRTWFSFNLLEDSFISIGELIKSEIGPALLDKIFEWRPTDSSKIEQ